MGRGPWYRSRPAGWFTVVACGGIAVALGWLAVTEPAERPAALAVGAVMGSVALLVAAGLRAPRARWSATSLDGRPAWVLELGDRRAALLLTLVTAALAVLLGGLVASDPRLGPAVLFGVPAVLLVVVTLEMGRIALVRRPRLLLTSDGVDLRSTGLDARLAWADVGTVEYADAGSRHASVALLAVRDAPSYEVRTRRLLLPTDRRPEPSAVPVRMTLVPDPAALLRLLRELHAAGEQVREARLGGAPPS